jgi:hypothetical protein
MSERGGLRLAKGGIMGGGGGGFTNLCYSGGGGGRNSGTECVCYRKPTAFRDVASNRQPAAGFILFTIVEIYKPRHILYMYYSM